MAEYHPLISRAVAALEPNSSETRRALYDRARDAQLQELHKRPFSREEFDRERSMLENAIRRVEGRFKSDERPFIARKSVLPAVARAAFVPLWILLAVGCFAAVLFFFEFSVRGAVWLSDKAIEYMAWPVDIALVLCVAVFPPLLLFRRTRSASAIGFLISSYIFGASTWMAGVLATYSYLGGFWLAVGLFIIGVGVVPLGILGAMVHSDWTAAGFLFLGLLLTFGVRWIGIGVGAWAAASR